MNWTIQTTADKIDDAELVIERGEQDKASAKPDPALVKATRKAAKDTAALMGLAAARISVEAHAHETTAGRGFRPAHVSLTLSRIAPSA